MRHKNLATPSQKILKSFPAFISETKENGDLGVVTAIVSVMGNIDHHQEIITNGAFKKTITERWHKIRVLDNHRYQSAEDAIGKLLTIREIGKNELPPELLNKYPDATGGLLVEIQFILDEPTDKSAKIFRRIKQGLIDEYSIGFNIIQSEWRTVKTDQGEYEVRFISEIKLFEVSPVIFAANDATDTVGAKSEDVPVDEITMPQQKAIPGYEMALAEESCKNCQFYKAVTGKNGYCEQFSEAVNSKYHCNAYGERKAVETISTRFKSSLSEFFTAQISDYVSKGIMTPDDEERLSGVSDLLIDTVLNLLPSDIMGREIVEKEYQTPKSDDPEAGSKDLESSSSTSSDSAGNEALALSQLRASEIRANKIRMNKSKR